jgi:hypothetical protein
MIQKLTNNITTPCNYVSNSRASNEYRTLSGCTTAVPVEQDGGSGTACGHWDETCFKDELMTGFNTGILPLSRMTVATLEDIGYTVSYSNADPYASTNLDASCRCSNIEEVAEDPAEGQSMAQLSDIYGAWGLGDKNTVDGTLPADRSLLTVRRKLSDQGRMAAVEYGKQLLSAEQERKATMTGDMGDHSFVGHLFVSVLYLEEGLVYGVEVWADDDKRAL